MEKRVQFMASYTATTKAKVSDIWATWVDVSRWPTWDNGLESVSMRDSFKPGSTLLLTPKGAEQVTVQLKTVTQGEEFSDETKLPFGVLRNFHRMEKHGDFVRLTHEVHAEISPDAAGFFFKEIWPHMQKGLPEAVEKIIDLVQVQS